MKDSPGQVEMPSGQMEICGTRPVWQVVQRSYVEPWHWKTSKNSQNFKIQVFGCSIWPRVGWISSHIKLSFASHVEKNHKI